ncbi:MAG: alpha/beta hydrolase [Treponema sp.]|jgi:acetyl esterase|nr:alpha/beta hydrolase [Treponema sp.]
MFGIPKEKNYTREELLKKTHKIKSMEKRSSQSRMQKSALAGKELFLDTGEGKIRVLAYNLEKQEKLPLFVNIHGGGFILGNPEMDDPYMMNIAINANVKILNVDYSLSPQAPFPQALNECYAAVKYAQNNFEMFGIDPQKIAVGGHSAGGNLSAAIALKNNETKELNIKCIILDYPPLDIYTDPYLKPRGKGFVARFFLSPKIARIFNSCYCNNKEERKNPLISPVFAEKDQLKTFPPALIITAGKDSLCAEAEMFRDKLIEAGVETKHKRFESSPHGFTLSSKRADAIEGWQMMIEHLKNCLN